MDGVPPISFSRIPKQFHIRTHAYGWWCACFYLSLPRTFDHRSLWTWLAGVTVTTIGQNEYSFAYVWGRFWHNPVCWKRVKLFGKTTMEKNLRNPNLQRACGYIRVRSRPKWALDQITFWKYMYNPKSKLEVVFWYKKLVDNSKYMVTCKSVTNSSVFLCFHVIKPGCFHTFLSAFPKRGSQLTFNAACFCWNLYL